MGSDIYGTQKMFRSCQQVEEKRPRWHDHRHLLAPGAGGRHNFGMDIDRNRGGALRKMVRRRCNSALAVA
jgi:hypothetical protein